jgi:L-aspartate oxidase
MLELDSFRGIQDKETREARLIEKAILDRNATVGEFAKHGQKLMLYVGIGNSADADPAAVALMMTVSALRREESRGAHCRTDFPAQSIIARRSRLTLGEAIEAAAEFEPLPISRSA